MEIADQEEELSGSIVSFNGRNNTKIKSLVANIEPVQDLHGLAYPYPEGGGPNKLLPLTGRSENRTFSHIGANLYYLGASSSTYISPSAISNVTIAENSVSFQTSSSGYGIGFTVPVEPNTIYTFSHQDSNNAQISYWDDNNKRLGASGESTGTITFTTPANCAFAMVIFRPVTGNIETYTKPQVELGSTATTFASYSNECPISGWTGAEIEQTGVNVWDEEWELGDIDITYGTKRYVTNCFRSKNFISVVPGKTYYFKHPEWFYICKYGKDKSYIGFEG